MPDHEELEMLISRFLEAAEELLEVKGKQKPMKVKGMKPSDRLVDYWNGYCPACGGYLGTRKEETDPFYCRYCGQRISWDMSDRVF